MNDQTPKLAVIIVNYNVTFFLEQCLNSVARAMEKEPAEVWVVDNNSVDGSVEMVAEKFPWVRLIANKDNKGFSRANNQAMEQSSCKYQLLLNPDTVVEEETFKKVVDYMDAHPDVGGLGVRMVDGKGKFLPESKRGLPTPAVAFYKIFGISSLFPKSKRFGRYHLGYLSEFEINEIEILSGAFMLMRKEALDKVGLLDEDFFMYGEDIDLSYRILKGGYKNVYFPDTRIIHYKGESTKKSSVNYVFVFYRAMVIFARKHFSQKNAKLFSFLINSAIYFRAGLAIASRFVKRSTLPLIDALYLLAGLFTLTNYWHQARIEFPETTTTVLISCYTAVWMFANLIVGSYDPPVKLKKFVFGTVTGTAAILMFYALFPKEWQFSRLYILTGAAWIITYYWLSRLFLHAAIGGRFVINGKKNGNFAIIGNEEEFKRVALILRQTQPTVEQIIHVSPGPEKEATAVGTMEQLDQVCTIHKTDEIIFCAKDTTANQIIHWMTAIQLPHIDFKIAQPDSLFLIGSNSIETAGDLYIMDINAIAHSVKKRQKRLVDFICGALMLLLSPLLIAVFRQKGRYFRNAFRLLTGKITAVGYGSSASAKPQELPSIKPGILTPGDRFNISDESLFVKLDLLYAREYDLLTDIRIILRAWKQLDRLT